MIGGVWGGRAWCGIMCSMRKLKFGAVEAMPAVTGQSQKLTFISSFPGSAWPSPCSAQLNACGFLWCCGDDELTSKHLMFCRRRLFSAVHLLCGIEGQFLTLPVILSNMPFPLSNFSKRHIFGGSSGTNAILNLINVFII